MLVSGPVRTWLGSSVWTVPMRNRVKTDLHMAGPKLGWHGEQKIDGLNPDLDSGHGSRASHAIGFKLAWLMRGETPKPVPGCLLLIQ
ncbi:hypothetical protein NDU88_000744 [Pleurodeles waltl]|uniref:Uncharacterized protein n=1 Tax=Pleurodeles waltl TaxID=8319 RepID=A0AAV7S6J1_PLEWA|nr:hypothetical protein NDU88_000744 [Pleurodeles waltl]